MKRRTKSALLSAVAGISLLAQSATAQEENGWTQWRHKKTNSLGQEIIDQRGSFIVIEGLENNMPYDVTFNIDGLLTEKDAIVKVGALEGKVQPHNKTAFATTEKPSLYVNGDVFTGFINYANAGFAEIEVSTIEPTSIVIGNVWPKDGRITLVTKVGFEGEFENEWVYLDVESYSVVKGSHTTEVADGGPGANSFFCGTEKIEIRACGNPGEVLKLTYDGNKEMLREVGADGYAIFNNLHSFNRCNNPMATVRNETTGIQVEFKTLVSDVIYYLDAPEDVLGSPLTNIPVVACSRFGIE